MTAMVDRTAADTAISSAFEVAELWYTASEQARAEMGPDFQAHIETMARLLREAALAYLATRPLPQCKHGHPLRDHAYNETPCPDGCKFKAVGRFDVHDFGEADYEREEAKEIVARWSAFHGSILTAGLDELETSIARALVEAQVRGRDG